jgi:hypothetical protein
MIEPEELLGQIRLKSYATTLPVLISCARKLVSKLVGLWCVSKTNELILRLFGRGLCVRRELAAEISQGADARSLARHNQSRDDPRDG